MEDIKNVAPIFKQMEWFKNLKLELNSSSDRAVGILSGSVLDENLRKILINFLIDDKNLKKDFLGNQGVLNTFDSRIKACYYMGLIDDIEYKNLETIRKIRNKFAHTFEYIDFDTQAISDLCKNLYIPISKYCPTENIFKDNEVLDFDINPFSSNSTARERFLKTFEYLYLLLATRLTEIKPKKLKKFEDLETISAKRRKLNSKVEQLFNKEINRCKDNKNYLSNLIDSIEHLEQTYNKLQLEFDSINDNEYTKEEKLIIQNQFQSLKSKLDLSKKNINISEVKKELEVVIKELSASEHLYSQFKPLLHMDKLLADKWDEQFEKIKNKK